MMFFYLFVKIFFMGTTAFASLHLDPLSDEFIHHINSNQSMWRARRNFHRDRPLNYFKRLTGSLKDIGVNYLPEKRYEIVHTKLPSNFDAREHWKYCPTLKQIRDQGSCGSCWAVSAVSAMSDRVCINSTGKTNFYYSEDDVLSCCTNCGAGCDGGLLSKAWTYTQTEGTVSGGLYHSRHGCRPYEIPPCEHDVPGYRPKCGRVKKPKCRKVCQKSYTKMYSEDKKKIELVYVLKTKKAMKADIFKHGPITVSIEVYADFLHYESGVYKHVDGEYIGDHAVKLLGWGVENGIKYWIGANSWNTDWGDKGFFKILRGRNHCGVETGGVAGHVTP